jgi:hypothetical protein
MKGEKVSDRFYLLLCSAFLCLSLLSCFVLTSAQINQDQLDSIINSATTIKNTNVHQFLSADQIEALENDIEMIDTILINWVKLLR